MGDPRHRGLTGPFFALALVSACTDVQVVDAPEGVDWIVALGPEDEAGVREILGPLPRDEVVSLESDDVDVLLGYTDAQLGEGAAQLELHWPEKCGPVLPAETWRWPSPDPVVAPIGRAPSGGVCQFGDVCNPGLCRTRLVALEVESNGACGLAADGVAYCWSGFTQSRSGAYRVSGQYRQLAVGSWFACGLSGAGTVDCWTADYNEFGRPTREPGAAAMRLLGASADQVCGIDFEGRLVCWERYKWRLAQPRFKLIAPAFDDTCDDEARLAVGYSVACALRCGLVYCADTNQEESGWHSVPFSAEARVLDVYRSRVCVGGEGWIECIEADGERMASSLKGRVVALSGEQRG